MFENAFREISCSLRDLVKKCLKNKIRMCTFLQFLCLTDSSMINIPDELLIARKKCDIVCKISE